MEALIALLGVAGTAIAYIVTRLDQRNARTLLDRDLALIEKAKDLPEIRKALMDTAEAAAKKLAAESSRGLLSRTWRVLLVVGVVAFVVQVLTTLAQFSIYGQVVAVLGEKTVLAGSRVPEEFGRALSFLWSVSGATVCIIAAVFVVLGWVTGVRWMLAKERDIEARAKTEQRAKRRAGRPVGSAQVALDRMEPGGDPNPADRRSSGDN